jgi:nucleoside-diphosphate-sugar epimerase
LFDHAAAAGARAVVFLSSMSVYGHVRESVVTEATAIDSPDVYGQSKLAGEQCLAELADRRQNVAALALRLPAVVGRGARHNFLADTLAGIMAGAVVQARNPDAPFNNVVHVADLADFIRSYCEALPSGFRLGNIAASEALKIREVIGLLFRRSGRSERVNYVNTGKAPFTISLEGVRALGYRPRSVRDTLTAFVDDSIRPLRP